MFSIFSVESLEITHLIGNLIGQGVDQQQEPYVCAGEYWYSGKYLETSTLSPWVKSMFNQNQKLTCFLCEELNVLQ